MANRELAAYMATLGMVVLLSEVQLRFATWVGALVVLLALTQQEWRRMTISIALKIFLVLFGCIFMFERDRFMHSRSILRSLVFANVAVLIVPPVYNRRVWVTLQLTALALLTPRDILSDSARSYWWAHMGVLTMTYIHSGPFQQYTVALLLGVLPSLAALALKQSVERVVTYRCFGMLLVCSLPVLWTPSTKLAATPFRFPLERITSWNQLSDTLSALDDNLGWRAAIVCANICLLAAAAVKR